MNKCPDCGSDVPHEHNECPECGLTISQGESTFISDNTLIGKRPDVGSIRELALRATVGLRSSTPVRPVSLPFETSSGSPWL